MSTSGMKITVKSSDNHVFEVDEAVAMQSQMIKNMIEDGCADNCIPLPKVDSQTLVKVIEYCKKHADAAANDLKSFDAEFVNVDRDTLFDLIMAANYMKIESLLDLTRKVAANMIEKKTPEELSTLFNIKNDLTPEDEEEIRKENEWAVMNHASGSNYERIRRRFWVRMPLHKLGDDLGPKRKNHMDRIW